MNDKFYTSLGYTVGIREFMRDYLNVSYPWEGNITHYKMMKFLMDNGFYLPETVALSNISSDMILTGEVVFVRAESSSREVVDFKSKRGEIIAYRNPLRKSNEDRLLEEIQSGEYVHKLLSNPGYVMCKDRKVKRQERYENKKKERRKYYD